MKKRHKTSERQRMKKIKAYLFQKGFDNDVISQAFDYIDPQVTDEEEYDALVKQGDKAWKRYEKKEQGYKLINKTKSFLYSKGFQMELINRYIDEKEES